MTGRLGLALVACACAVALGCSFKPPQVGDPAPALQDANAESSYQSVLARYSSNRELYAVFDTRMLSAVTYQSWRFREARARRVAAFQALPPAVLEKRLADERAEADAYHDFFFGVAMNDSRYDDFDKKESIWRIALVTRAGEATPKVVERIGRSNLNLRALYPYLGDFWVAYRIRFDRKLSDGARLVADDEERIALRVASTLGQAEFIVPAH